MAKHTAIYEFGDVVLTSWLYTDGTGGGQPRPFVVVSARSFNEQALDVVLMPTSAQTRHAGRLGVVVIRNWKAAGFEQPSVVKPVLSSYPPDRIHKKIGQIDQRTAREIRGAIQTIFGAKPSKSG